MIIQSTSQTAGDTQLISQRAVTIVDCDHQSRASHPSVHTTVQDVLRVQGTSVVVGSYKKPREVDLLRIGAPEEAPEQFHNLLSGNTDAIKMLFELEAQA